MRSKAAPYILLIVLAIVVFLIVRLRQDSKANEASEAGTGKSSGAAANINRDRGFDRRTSFIKYTRHARCRMNCRNITMAEVEEIMKEGSINYRKSNAKGHPCPTYALEGNTSDDQRVRIVFAQCNEVTRVVTVIDLDKEWQCDCLGDDNKYQNQ